jgi:chemotaxis family two-component system response regulator Rcp1
MKTKSPFNRKAQLAFESAILALLVVGAMSFRVIAVSTESDRRVRHTHEVLENLQSSLSTMQDVEPSYRGFVITGDEQFFKSFGASRVRRQQEETIIRNLTEDNPAQQQQISTLHRLADQKIQCAETVMGLRRTKGFEAASHSLRTGEGQQILNEYRDAAAMDALLAEDSPGDVRLMREAFKDAKVLINLHVAPDGAEAMAFLGSEGQHLNSPRPDLILLDLNLPKKDGREVLEESKQSPALKSIPVVILTTSASGADILRSYMLHANCYITKPVDLNGFLTVVKSIDSLWLSVVKLPHEVRS